MKKETNNLTDTNLPWYNKPSIYEHIKSNIRNDGILESTDLPGEKELDEEIVRFDHGTEEGMFFHFTDFKENIESAQIIANHLIEISKSDSLSEKIELYNFIQRDELISALIPSMRLIVEAQVDVEPYLYNYAKWLAFESSSTGSVKLGIKLLSKIEAEEEDDVVNEMVFNLGKHDEFTLHTVLLILSKFEDYEVRIWKLAKLVSGWGRIHTIYFLVKTKNPEIKNWILRKGFIDRNMVPYLAYMCAVAGDLKIELQKSKIDEELIIATGELIKALILGGPIDINSYEDGPEVFSLYLKHISQTTNYLRQLPILDDMRYFLIDEGKSSEYRDSSWWPEKLRAELVAKIDELIDTPNWIQMIIDNLASKDENNIREADQAAEILGIDSSKLKKY